ncbi:hypothetical protein EYF80_021038 [Liparis tanakae]|uniref:Secreted protein n=1 Tax=Liparis tanakae TaxID=230148 RepID=A0A4Z2HSA6_9TELE|nr:hypothetical protein EYF80_021038 [Liparis tanakae]
MLMLLFLVLRVSSLRNITTALFFFLEATDRFSCPTCSNTSAVELLSGGAILTPCRRDGHAPQQTYDQKPDIRRAGGPSICLRNTSKEEHREPSLIVGPNFQRTETKKNPPDLNNDMASTSVALWPVLSIMRRWCCSSSASEGRCLQHPPKASEIFKPRQGSETHSGARIQADSTGTTQ